MKKVIRRSTTFILALLVAGIMVYTTTSNRTTISQKPNFETVLAQARPFSPQGINYFLKIESIPGESTDDKHKGEIDVNSYSWGESGSGINRSAGEVTVSDISTKAKFDVFHIAKTVDKASPLLFLKAANGEHIPKVILSVRRTNKDQADFLKIMFTDVVLSSFRASASGQGDGLPRDEINLKYAKIEWQYREQKLDGSLGPIISAGWDVQENKAI